MSVDPRVHHAPRASPVAELPLERLVDRSEELARRWAIALVLARSLESLAEVPLEELAREAPLLCSQVLRALSSEQDLEALERSLLPSGGGSAARASRLAEISGARGAIALAEAVEALRGVIWSAVSEELDAQGDGSAPAFAPAACDRLAFVCSRALVSSLAGAAAERHLAAQPARPGSGTGAQPVEAPRRIALTPALERFERLVGAREDRAPAPTRRLLIVDERAPASAAERREENARAPQEIEVRDVRSEHGRPPWVAAIARELEVHRRSGRGFAVLVIELRGQPLREAETVRNGAAGFAEDVERVLSAELRQAARAITLEQPGVLRAGARSGSLTREGPGRFWMIAPQLDRSGAASLVRRLERAVARPASHGGGPLDVTIGAAVCPEDGTDAAALAEHADLELYASRPSSALRAPGEHSAGAEGA